MEKLKKYRIAEDMGGHDGIANGGHYGRYSVLFGIFPDSAVIVKGEKPGAVHTRQTGNRLNYHHDRWEKEFFYDESLLRPGDFIAIEQKYHGLVYNSNGGDIKILAHRLPIGADIPESWEPVGGQRSSYSNGYGGTTSWSFIRTSDGSPVAFDEAVKELGLTEMRHPYGKIWLNGDKPVAITEKPTWSSGRDSSFYNEAIFGSRRFFAANGLAVLEYDDKNTYYGAGDFYSCSQEVICRGLEITNLREEGWYPVEVRDHFVVWGTGLHLYPKHLEWQIGLDPAHGTADDKRGTRIFDSSRNRLNRVREFFREAVGLAVGDPEAEYIRWANGTDPRGGRWRNSHHYPPCWTPHFSGWHISRFGKVECRWKQPKCGTARFYGVVRK